MDAFKAAARTPEFAATGKDAMEMGVPFQVPLRRRRLMPEPTHPRPVDPAELGFETIVYEKAPPRATIRLNRPEVLNAFDFRMLREIARACEDASLGRRGPRRRRHRHGARLLRRRRPAHVGRRSSASRSEYWKWFGAFKDMHDRLRELGKPTIARINGIAVGGGNELQMACDLAVIVDDAFIRHVGLEHGSVPAGGATQWLQLMVGDRRAREIVLLCDEIPAAQAAEWGLVNRAVPAAELDAVVDEWVESLARKLPQTTRYAKQQLNVLARPRLAPDDRPRPRLARAVDARRRGAGRRRAHSSSGSKTMNVDEMLKGVAATRMAVQRRLRRPGRARRGDW